MSAHDLHPKLEVDQITKATKGLANRPLTDAPRLEVRVFFPRVFGLIDEWFEDVTDPEALIETARESGLRPDLVTFWQRLPETTPRFRYYLERDSIAALPLTTFENWWEKQVAPASRNKIRKATKQGVVVRGAEFDDAFVQGMTSIFNESPIRQGRRFLHYGKSFENVKKQFSRFLFREHLIGAYLGDELIGFMMIGDAGHYGVIGQIISKIGQRNRAPNNAMLAEAVRYCISRGFSHVAYAYWLEGGLGEFKVSNGFKRFDLPRYYVPITSLGKLGLQLGLHRGIKEAIPIGLRDRLKGYRSRFYSSRVSPQAL